MPTIREAYSGYYDKSRDAAFDVELTDATHYKRVSRRVGHPPTVNIAKTNIEQLCKITVDTTAKIR